MSNWGSWSKISKLQQERDFLFDGMGSGRFGSEGNQKCPSNFFILRGYIDYVYRRYHLNSPPLFSPILAVGPDITLSPPPSVFWSFSGFREKNIKKWYHVKSPPFFSRKFSRSRYHAKSPPLFRWPKVLKGGGELRWYLRYPFELLFSLIRTLL